eukprot:s2663_g9.t1
MGAPRLYRLSRPFCSVYSQIFFLGQPAALTMVQLIVDEHNPDVKHLYKPFTLHIGAPWCPDKGHTRHKVHEPDLVAHYPLLKEYLILFAPYPDGLPDLEHHKAWEAPLCLTFFPPTPLQFCPDGMQAAVALLAVTLNLFPQDLYLKKGGRGKVKDRRSFYDH